MEDIIEYLLLRHKGEKSGSFTMEKKMWLYIVKYTVNNTFSDHEKSKKL